MNRILHRPSVTISKTVCALLLGCFFTVSLACSHSAARAVDESARVPVASTPVKQLLDAAIEQTKYTRSYDPAYSKIAYPNGDVPIETGVCSDVVIRAFRKVGIDLQKEVHEDMARNFSAYPNRWGLKRPDTNIDHRRVPNLMTYFQRKGKAIAITTNAADYKPGDIVAWDLGGGVTHIGLMTDMQGDSGRYQIVHNIGWGTRVEDRLFEWRIIGHYRYF